MPRIISGIYGGRRLKAPAGDHTRPTSDRVKEALFSAVTARLPWTGCRVLDLFAGSGQLGLEALSRGAAKTVLVEKDRRSAAIVHGNIKALGVSDQAELLQMPADRALKLLGERGDAFDLILLDPPYREAMKELLKLDRFLPDKALLKTAGLLVLEHEKDTVETASVTNLKLVKRCQYGTTMLSFLVYN